MDNQFAYLKSPISLIIILFNCCFVWAQKPVTQVPFTYVIDYTNNQESLPEFRSNFSNGVPTLFHSGSGMRYLGRFGFGGMVLENRTIAYQDYLQQIQDYLEFLRQKGVRWVTPYLCNQTISGNYQKRYGVWEVWDHWEEYHFLQLGPKPSDPIEWMQREPSGNLHYNYKRKCFLERHNDNLQIRYAPCPNNQDWRNLMNAEARQAARVGFAGLFIDNNIIHCYCQSCQTRFQEYLKQKYSVEELERAFNTRTYQDITLYKEGDYRFWARTFPEFIPWFKKKYSPEKRRIYFDTTGPLTEVNVDAAGGGMLFGECEKFLAEQLFPPDAKPSYEEIRLANQALQTAKGRLRWAETVMFWATSIGDQLAEMTAAGRTVNKNFFLIPNWGVRQRILGAAGRAEDGKNMRLWAKGAKWQMYEEDSATGTIVPGIVLDYDAELRYAYACGVRAMLLPYTLDDPDVEKVHHAEVAASGGSVFVTTFRNPEIRSQYRDLFEKHPDLFDGYISAAKVALAHFFDQVHYLNVEHLREVYAINRYLADQQIPFDHLIETDFTQERLNDYRVIILANIEFMSDRQITAIQNFINRDGTVLLIGKNALYNMYAQTRKTNPVFTPCPGDANNLIVFSKIDLALPYRGMFLETALQASRSKVFSLDFDGTKYDLLKEIDRVTGIKRYITPGPITEAIKKAFKKSPHLILPEKAVGIRNTTWIKKQKDNFVLTIHLVNKNVPLASDPGKCILTPVRNLKITLPDMANKKNTTAYFYQPGSHVQKLQVVTDDQDQQHIIVSELKAYGIVEVKLESLSVHE